MPGMVSEDFSPIEIDPYPYHTIPNYQYEPCINCGLDECRVITGKAISKDQMTK
jgi:hypothetical protein